MLLPLLQLGLLASLLVGTAPQDGNPVWRDARDDWMALDPLTADPDLLEAALAEVAAGGPSQDPDACVWAARAALVLYARLRQQGDPARGRAALDLALPMCTQPGGAQTNLWITASSHASLIADYPASLAAAARAEDSLDEAQRASSLPVFIWSLRAQALIQMGVPDQAAPWVERAVEHALALRGTEGFDPGALIEAYLKRANLRMATDRYERMVEELEQVLADDELLAGNSLARARFLLRLGMAYLWSVRGDDEAAAQARARLREALAQPGIQAQDRLTVHMRLAQLELLAGDVEAAREPLELARALATQMGGAGGAVLSMDEALLCAVEARVVRLDTEAGAQARAAARRRLLQAYDAQLANWRARPESRTGVGFLRYPIYQDVVAEVVEGELAAAPGEAGRRAALLQLARARSVGDLAEALGAHEPEWSAIAALVPEGGGLLVWLGAPGASHVFGLDAAGTVHGRVADLRDVQATRDALERLLAQTPAGLPASALERRRTELAANAARLGELLLTPQLAERVAGWSALTLVADDLAGASAIQLLPLRNERGEVAPLCLSRPAAFLPGLAVGAALSERTSLSVPERPYVRDLGLVADVQPSQAARERFGDLTPLPIDAALLARWRAPFLDARVENLCGERATLAGLEAAPPARVLHFVTHGVRDVTRVRAAGLALTPGADDAGLLFGADVERLPAPALVVLSVCSAGRGPERVGDAGSSDLSGAFLAAGADAVLLSAVDLPFEPVARYVPLLHAELARGATPAEALWRARSQVARDPDCADPFHHLAGLRVLGLGHRPLFRARPQAEPAAGEPAPQPGPRRTTFGVLIAAAFLVPAWLILRRRRAG